MNERITIRLPKEFFRLLKGESAKLGISVSVLVRQGLQNFLIETSKKISSEDLEKPAECKIQEAFKSQYPLIQENNLLLRKIARYTNSQIVIETDEQLKQFQKKGES